MTWMGKVPTLRANMKVDLQAHFFLLLFLQQFMQRFFQSGSPANSAAQSRHGRCGDAAEGADALQEDEKPRVEVIDTSPEPRLRFASPTATLAPALAEAASPCLLITCANSFFFSSSKLSTPAT